MGFPGGSVVKKPPANAANSEDMGLTPGVRKIPWRRKWQLTPVFQPGKIPWTEESGMLQSKRSQRVGHNLATKQQR